MFLSGSGANLFEFGKGKYKDRGLIKCHLPGGSDVGKCDGSDVCGLAFGRGRKSCLCPAEKDFGKWKGNRQSDKFI